MLPLLTWSWPETPLTLLAITSVAVVARWLIVRAVKASVDASLKRARDRNVGQGSRAERVLAAATGDGLSDEQQVAAVRLVASRDLVTLMVAPAGAGKTTVLGAAVAGWASAGQRVLVLGPSARAASELAASTGRPGATVARSPPCLLYTSPSPRDGLLSRMPSSA